LSATIVKYVITENTGINWSLFYKNNGRYKNLLLNIPEVNKGVFLKSQKLTVQAILQILFHKYNNEMVYR